MRGTLYFPYRIREVRQARRGGWLGTGAKHLLLASKASP